MSDPLALAAARHASGSKSQSVRRDWCPNNEAQHIAEKCPIRVGVLTVNNCVRSKDPFVAPQLPMWERKSRDLCCTNPDHSHTYAFWKSSVRSRRCIGTRLLNMFQNILRRDLHRAEWELCNANSNSVSRMCSLNLPIDVVVRWLAEDTT
jgi:hypothetical protein